MSTYIALLRGVNAGGVILEMEDFRTILEYIGFQKIRIHAQSGNAIFETNDSSRKKMEAEISYEIRNKIGNPVVVVLLTLDELRSVAAAHPLASFGDPENQYVTVLVQEPGAADAAILLDTMNGVDTHEVVGRMVYSYYGEGYEKSRRTNNFIEKVL
ncbi:MAG: DUF1697 domain-containing protein, partial [Methanosarcinaceae archaeon]|nr:DUF1697 domain-containing protein [Methanosarcinaceae archaeon]